MHAALTRLLSAVIGLFTRRRAAPAPADPLADLLAARSRNKRRLERIVCQAADAVLAAAPGNMPRVKDRAVTVGFDRDHDSVVYVFDSETDLVTARRHLFTVWLSRRTRQELLARGYPAEAVGRFAVTTASRETMADEGGRGKRQYSR